MAALLQGQAEGNFPLSCPEELDSVLVQTWGASYVHVQSGSEESGGLPAPSSLPPTFLPLLPPPWCSVLWPLLPCSPALGCRFFLPSLTVSGASLATFLEDAVLQGGRWCSQVWLAGLPRPGSLCQGHVLENTFVVVLYLENFL